MNHWKHNSFLPTYSKHVNLFNIIKIVFGYKLLTFLKTI